MENKTVRKAVLIMAKYYKMGTDRQKLHKKIYDRLVKKGMDGKKAYEIASKITNWA